MRVDPPLVTTCHVEGCGINSSTDLKFGFIGVKRTLARPRSAKEEEAKTRHPPIAPEKQERCLKEPWFYGSNIERRPFLSTNTGGKKMSFFVEEWSDSFNDMQSEFG